MALFRRNKTWWTDFSVNGQRYRQSLQTTDWREAQRLEKDLIAQACAGKLAASGQPFARMAFRDAAERFLADRLAHLTPKGIQIERERGKPLKGFFGALPLRRITLDGILAYFAERKTAGISNATINRELDVLRGILKRAKRWHQFADDIKPLPIRHDTGRALSYEEKVRLLKTAASRLDWEVAYCASVLAFNTTMRSCEIRGLRWRDVNFLERTLKVRRSFTKTDAGERVIPLNADALAAILQLRERAKLLFGAVLDPDWYILPRHIGYKVKPDPTRPMSSWRSAWRSLRKAAGLAGLRFHDLRHHAITELAESAASDQTIMAIAGHVSHRMLAHYSHVRLEAKRRALDALSGTLSGRTRDRGYGTNKDTNASHGSTEEPQLTEKIGGADGIRTHDLLDAIEARFQLRHGPTETPESL
jgi:integrase